VLDIGERQSCPAQEVFCDGVCVDEASDPQNCGACSVRCAADEVCVSGSCSPVRHDGGAEDAPSAQPDGALDAPRDDAKDASADGAYDAPVDGSEGGPGDPPSCAGLAATCGPAGSASCCASGVVTGGYFNRSSVEDYPATVTEFRLDIFEVTVGRFRRFVDVVVAGWAPATGSGKHSHLNGGAGVNSGTEGGWDPSWSGNLASDKATWDSRLNCAGSASPTWTPDPGSNERRPVTCITWYEAYAFCIWDEAFLPTEAEWNYASAGGSEQRVYPWSDPPSATTVDDSYAVFCPDVGSCPWAQEVGSKSTKGDGIYHQADLGGNVWEWVLDWFADYPSSCIDCANLTPASERAARGGGYLYRAQDMASGFRDLNAPSYRSVDVGTRCARVP
jgi:formylglycine-generating enzyme